MNPLNCGANTNWERVTLSEGCLVFLRGENHIWSRLYDGEPVFVVLRIGEEPNGTDGYDSIAKALRVRGLRS